MSSGPGRPDNRREGGAFALILGVEHDDAVRRFHRREEFSRAVEQSSTMITSLSMAVASTLSSSALRVANALNTGITTDTRMGAQIIHAGQLFRRHPSDQCQGALLG